MNNYEGLPILPVEDTKQIFRAMKEGEWKNPAPTESHGVIATDTIFINWIDFLEQAREGYPFVENARKNDDFGGYLSDIQSFFAIEEALEGDKVQFPEDLVKIENALAQLLSKEGKK